MSIERFIARRYLLGKKRFSFINIIALLATMGIAFGVAALVVVMSVFNGFGGLVTEIMLKVDPHIRIEKTPRKDGIPAARIDSILAAEKRVIGRTRVSERKAMAISKGYTGFVQVKGHEAATVDDVSGIRSAIVMGRASHESPFAILVGITLADKLRLLEGDTLELVSPAGMQSMLTQYVTPPIFYCPVAGIYDSKNKKVDAGVVFLPLAAAVEFFHADEDAAGFEIKLADIDYSNEVKNRLSAEIGAGWNILTWYDLHKDLYSVMRIERWSAFVLLGVIIAVAVFNILASLTMLVLEKRRDIGILRTMGVSAARIRRIFLLQGFWIGVTGVVAGTTLGLIVCWLQHNFGLLKLDAAFIIPALPVDPRLPDIAIIAVATFALCLLAAWYPAGRAGNVEIIDAVRWE